MLKHLHIQNYALIDSIDLDLSSGLSVITGETGAGKSILLGAISLLMGQRADSKTLFDESKKCIIEGVFSIQAYPHLANIFEQEEVDFEEPCLIRREINPQGKSRSFINDTPVTLESLRTIGQELMDIHSQQDASWLAHPDFSLELIDSFAQQPELKTAYSAAFKEMQRAQADFLRLEKQAAQGNQGLDFTKFQWEELDKAQLRAEEFEGLIARVAKLENAEQIREKLAGLANLVSLSELSTVQHMRLALQQAQSLAKFGEEYEQWKVRLDSIWIELKDLSSEIEREAEDFSSDPQELIEKQKRLDTLQRLMQKHQKNTVEELIELQNSLDDQIASFEHIDEAVSKAKQVWMEAQELCEQKGKELSACRQAVLPAIQSALTESLQHLGIPNAVLAWEIEARTCVATGMDKISLLFSANKGLAPKPFKQIASGGELSRLMLSVKHLLAQKRAMPTLILDEIDTGVSGEVAFQMANMLRQMGQAHQIIAITHLPQIAAAGRQHWFVYKNHQGEKTVSSIRCLTEEDRVDEIAKMIGGQKGYQALKENVRELLAANEK